jgi:hypothetical protein
VTPEQLSKQWNIGLAQSKQTLWVTTQQGVQSTILPLSWRYGTDQMFNQRKLRGQQFYTNTLIGKYKLVTNNMCAQLFANESFLVKAYQRKRNLWLEQHSDSLSEILASRNVLHLMDLESRQGPKLNSWNTFAIMLLITTSSSLTDHSRTKQKPQYGSSRNGGSDRWPGAKFLNDFGTTV